jgi:acyl-CoA synthetase (AMP-forming)/AMP-acid ligase II
VVVHRGYGEADEDDFIYLVDRKDLIISGGENVFPVEVRISSANYIKDVAAIGYPDERLGKGTSLDVAGKSTYKKRYCNIANN